MTRCAMVPEMPLDTFGDTAGALTFMFNYYGSCAARHNSIVDYEEQVNGN